VPIPAQFFRAARVELVPFPMADRYPPICTIVLDAGTKSGSPMWWRSSFFWITPRMNSARSSSLAPRRIWAWRSWSHTENRQVRILPSLVMRMRLQCPQKGMRDRGDDADFADAVVEAVAARGFGARVRDFDQRPVLGHAGQDFVERDHRRGRPGAAFFERHEFDEAHGDAFFAGEHAEGDDLIFVEAAHEHAVHFQGPESGAAGGADAGEDVVVSVGDAGDAGEAVGIDGVHGDGDAGEAGGFERLREIGEQVAVGGERDVEGIGVCVEGRTPSSAPARHLEPATPDGRASGASINLGSQLRELAHELDYAFAQERLAAGEADFRDPHADQHARHAEVIVEGKIAVERAFVAGAAVDTLVVAAVGDGDPQVGDAASEFVGEERRNNLSTSG
jgi:hypothetical protein